MRLILDQLRSDHKQLMKLLYQFEQEVKALGGMASKRPNYDWIFEVLNYIQLYPEVWHHPVEDIIYRVAEGAFAVGSAEYNALRQVQVDHETLETLTAYLQHLFNQLAAGAGVSYLQVIKATDHYVRRQHEHIQLEQNVIFHLVEESLGEQDWDQIRAVARRLRQDFENDQPDFNSRYRDIELSCALTTH